MEIKIGLIGAEGRLGKTIAALYPIFPITKSTSRLSLPCNVLIDVSSANALQENLSAKKPIVIGTTGHLDFSPIQEASKHFPIFYAANFSLGAAILQKLSRYLAKHFPSDIDLIETHHVAKKDAPSGTALALAKNLPNAKIHSIRSGNIIGEHTLLFNTPHERITLSHEAHSREAFAQGAILAAEFLFHKGPGLYTMDNLFEEL